MTQIKPANSGHRDGPTLSALITLMRPYQWLKNGFVLCPLVFAGQFLELAAVLNALLAFFLFCVASSATYIVNDIHDIESDRQHPNKRKTRPLASGALKVPHAVMMLLGLYAVLVCGYFRLPEVLLVIIAYMVLNQAYTFFLKYQPVLDIFSIAGGFVLRVYAGAIALSVPVSSWMFVTTMCLALFLGAVKRRQELRLSSGGESREVLQKYTATLVTRYAEMAATGALVFYGLFVMSARPEMVITIPLVIFGLFRYWFVVESRDEGESPTDVVLHDWQLACTVLLWIVASIWALWPEASLPTTIALP